MSYFTLCVKINISIVIKSILIYTQRECRRLSKKNDIIEQSTLPIYCALQYLLLFCEMTDCDLCGSRIPIVIPFLVFRPLLKFAYPEGVWKGLCEKCLDSAEKTYLDINKDEISCRKNKCSLCGRRDNVFLVKLQIPDYSKGVVTRDKNLCSKLLEAIDEVYLRDNK